MSVVSGEVRDAAGRANVTITSRYLDVAVSADAQSLRLESP